MEFANPWALALAGLSVPIVALALMIRGASFAVPAAAGVAHLRPTFRLRAARALPFLRAFAICLLAVALARPRDGDANAVVPADGIDIALALDISSSMTANTLDNKTRLVVAKQVIRDFIKGRENDRIGLVVFQRDAIPLAPPTLDYEALDKVVASLESGILPDGTGIGVGIGTALNMLRDSPAASRIVILLTDGQHNADSISPRDAADLAKALNVKLYTIGLLSDRAGRDDVDEALMTEISEATGGRFYSASSQTSLEEVYEEIARLETSKVGREHFERFSEYAWWFLAGAAVLLMVELALRGSWLRRVPA
jgi:Ca-activated chloride channel family protein